MLNWTQLAVLTDRPAPAAPPLAAPCTPSVRIADVYKRQGLDYLHERYPQFAAIPVVKTSNFIGDTLDMAAAAHFEQVLLLSLIHI